MVVAVPVGVSRIRDETHRNATMTSTTTLVPSHANRWRCVVVASHLLRSCVCALLHSPRIICRLLPPRSHLSSLNSRLALTAVSLLLALSLLYPQPPQTWFLVSSGAAAARSSATYNYFTTTTHSLAKLLHSLARKDGAAVVLLLFSRPRSAARINNLHLWHQRRESPTGGGGAKREDGGSGRRIYEIRTLGL